MLEREGLTFIKLAFLACGRSKPYTIINFKKKIIIRHPFIKSLAGFLLVFLTGRVEETEDSYPAQTATLSHSGGSTVRLLHVVKTQHESKRSVIYRLQCEAFTEKKECYFLRKTLVCFSTQKF